MEAWIHTCCTAPLLGLAVVGSGMVEPWETYNDGREAEINPAISSPLPAHATDEGNICFSVVVLAAWLDSGIGGCWADLCWRRFWALYESLRLQCWQMCGSSGKAVKQSTGFAFNRINTADQHWSPFVTKQEREWSVGLQKRLRFSAALLPRLFWTKVPGHTTRAPPVRF